VRRSRLALGLAVGGLAAALVGALGPAEEVRTTYTWPPPALPEAKPDRLWHTPLMLLSRRPEAISAAIPCRLPPALPRAPRPTTVLGTTRDPAATGGLAVTRASEQLAVAVGEHVLVRAPLRLGENGEQCTYRLRLAVNTWRLEGGQLEDARVGDLVAMPVVHGLFSGLDLAAGMPVSVDVTTTVHDVRPTAVQTLAWLLAAAAIAAALGLVAFGRTPRIPRPEVGRIVARAHPADAVVAVALVGWWILSPAFWDDGWIAARLESYSESGGFSSYYDILGSNNPLGFWLDWVHRLFMHVSDSLLVLRLPVLLSLAATWALCRYVLGRSLRGAPADVALWALASMLLLGAFAWGMNLRPEFALALLVTGTAACTLRFLERETAAPLALAGVLVPLAILAHPAGFVTLAPLLLASPRLLRWARSRLAAASAVVASSVAALVLLGFVGSDLEQRRQDVRTFEEYGTSTQTWRDESLRYVRMSEIPYATPVRRAWVALTALAVVAFLLRRRAENRLLDLPQAATGLGLVLLVATPSKWPSHFGALLGLAAVAVAVETARLRADAEGARRWDARPFVVAGLAMLAAAWSWSPRTPWAHLDLRVLDWILGFESRLSLSKLMFALPLVLLIGLAILTALRHGRAGLSAVPWKVATWTALVVSIPPLVFTVAVLTADNLKADGWTLARQNLGTLRGDADCGLAEELGVERLLEDESTRTYVVPDLLVYFPCVRQPRIGGGIAEAPDYAISRFEDSGLEAWEASPFHPVVQLYPLDQVPLTNGPPTEVFLYQVGGMPGAAKALPVSTEGGSR
jgi:arabinosyltransferase A